MHHPDGFIRPDDPAQLVHVGWLERGHDFDRGEVPRAFFAKLVALAEDPFQPFAFAGHHSCDLHQFTGGPGRLSFEGTTVSGLFYTNLFIPDGARIFYAPSAIVHYIDAFFYRPPDDFIAAVMNCPPMRSMEFKKLFLSSGWAEIAPPRPPRPTPPTSASR